MPTLVALIIHDPTKTGDVLNAWVDAGVTGTTILNSSGLSHLMRDGPLEGLPLFPSLDDILQSREEHHRLIFSVVADSFDLDKLVAATETVVGRLDDPHTGIMFAMPVTRTWGLQP